MFAQDWAIFALSLVALSVLISVEFHASPFSDFIFLSSFKTSQKRSKNDQNGMIIYLPTRSNVEEIQRQDLMNISDQTVFSCQAGCRHCLISDSFPISELELTGHVLVIFN